MGLWSNFLVSTVAISMRIKTLGWFGRSRLWLSSSSPLGTSVHLLNQVTAMEIVGDQRQKANIVASVISYVADHLLVRENSVIKAG